MSMSVHAVQIGTARGTSDGDSATATSLTHPRTPTPIAPHPERTRTLGKSLHTTITHASRILPPTLLTDTPPHTHARIARVPTALPARAAVARAFVAAAGVNKKGHQLRLTT